MCLSESVFRGVESQVENNCLSPELNIRAGRLEERGSVSEYISGVQQRSISAEPSGATCNKSRWTEGGKKFKKSNNACQLTERNRSNHSLIAISYWWKWTQVLQQPANNKLACLLEKNVISMKRWEETWRLIGSSTSVNVNVNLGSALCRWVYTQTALLGISFLRPWCRWI